jgi:histidinol-phosphate aminotransferase
MSEREPVTLDRNENHYGPAPACLAALRDLAPDLLHDYPRDFLVGSYSRLSRRLAAMHGVTEGRIMLGYGCEDILKEAVHHYVGPGGALLVPSASWWYYRAVADEACGETIEYPLVEGATAYRYELETLLALRDRVPVRLLLIATPNNPTGNRITRPQLREVLEAYRGIPTLLDQAYFGFSEDGPDDWAELTEEFPDLLVLRSFSKLYALAGARIGYAIAGVRHHDFVTICSRCLGYNRVSEELALAALDSPAYYQDVRERMAADRGRLYEALRQLPGVRAYDSDANFVLARFPLEIVATLDAELRRRGFVVKFFKEAAFLDCARITIGTEAESARLVAAMREVLPALLPASV